MDIPSVDGAFTKEVAQLYDSTLVPIIFEDYALDLAERAREFRPTNVLEIACGTGVVTRSLAAVLPENCAITATDLSSVMVDFGASVGTSRPVVWDVADVMSLPYEDNQYDLVVCQFGTMFFPDRAAAYQEVRRVLRPKSAFLFNVWKSVADNEFADTVTTAMGSIYPDDPPTFLVRTPHGHGSPGEIEEDLVTAGFECCVLNQCDETSVAATPDLVAVAYCHGTPLRSEIESRESGGLDRATKAVSKAVQKRFGSGPVRGKISAFVVVAT